jgi:hypothetical protein
MMQRDITTTTLILWIVIGCRYFNRIAQSSLRIQEKIDAHFNLAFDLIKKRLTHKKCLTKFVQN